MSIKFKTIFNNFPEMESNLQIVNGKAISVGVKGEQAWLASIHEYGCHMVDTIKAVNEAEAEYAQASADRAKAAQMSGFMGDEEKRYQDSLVLLEEVKKQAEGRFVCPSNQQESECCMIQQQGGKAQILFF